MKLFFVFLFGFVFILLGCKKEEPSKAPPFHQKYVEKLSVALDHDFTNQLLCSYYAWEGDYFFTPDYGCLYAPDEGNNWGNLVFYLFPKTENYMGDQIDIDDFTENEIKEHFNIIVTLIEPHELQYFPNGDSPYSPVENYKQLIISFYPETRNWFIENELENPKSEDTENAIMTIAQKFKPKSKKINLSGLKNEFKEFPKLTLPLTDKDFKGAMATKNLSYFLYEYDKEYYSLYNNWVLCYGTYEKNGIYNVIYGFNLEGQGEGFQIDMILLSQFDEHGNHLGNIILAGYCGGEGYTEEVENFELTENKITIHYKESHHESATGLGSTIEIYRKKEYIAENGVYQLISNGYRNCESLGTLKDLKNLFKNAQFDQENENLAYAKTYQLDYYLACQPIDNTSVQSYNDIAFYMDELNLVNPSINLLRKIIRKYPERVVAHLNIADAYWKNEEIKKATWHYNQYVDLMKSQGKDLTKIPLRVYERIDN
jgi:hypothetical protein